MQGLLPTGWTRIPDLQVHALPGPDKNKTLCQWWPAVAAAHRASDKQEPASPTPNHHDANEIPCWSPEQIRRTVTISQT
eukprot:3234979-Rhodomonas_salina.1